MKKTLLLSLLSLSGAALADVTLLADFKSYEAEDGSQTVGLFGADGQLISDVSCGGFNVNENGVISTSGRPNSTAGTTGSITTGGHVSGLTMGNFSLTFTADWTTYNDDAQWPNLVVFGESGGDYTYKVFYDIASNSFSLASAGYDGGIALTTQVGGLTLGGEHDYILTLSTGEDNFRTISFYQDGALVLEGTTTQYFGQAQNVRFGFGGSFGGDQGAKINSLSNVQIYSGILPEPTTVTLSLLALVGLAARRRRK